MNDTHEYPVTRVQSQMLNETHTLVGESGGLSAVYGVMGEIFGGLAVETEHGMLFLNHEDEVVVLDAGV